MTCSYAFTGAEQTFTVPTGVTAVQVTAIGGAGGTSGNSQSGAGGRGGIASGALTGLSGGSTLYVEVGGSVDNSDNFALGAYLNEALVHGWELAVATGQDPEADPAVVALGREIAERILPAQGREHFPFDPPVEPAADAGPTERLANWAGRRTTEWRRGR